MHNATHIVRAERRRNDRLIFEQQARERFEIHITLGFCG